MARVPDHNAGSVYDVRNPFWRRWIARTGKRKRASKEAFLFWLGCRQKTGLGSEFLGDDFLRRLVDRPADHIGVIRVAWDWIRFDVKRLLSYIHSANVCASV